VKPVVIMFVGPRGPAINGLDLAGQLASGSAQLRIVIGSPFLLAGGFGVFFGITFRLSECGLEAPPF
jgi:hypothetical protein